MRRRWKKVIRLFILVVMAVVGLALAALTFLILDKPLTKRLLFTHFSRRTGVIFEAGRLDFRLFPLRVEVGGLTVLGTARGQDLRIEVDKFEALGSIGRLFSRHRPLFAEITIEKAFLRTRVDPTRSQRIDWKSAADALQRLGPLRVRNAGLEVSFPGGRAGVAGADLDLRSAGQSAVFLFSLSAVQTTFGSDKGRMAFSGTLRSAGELRLAGRLVFRGELTIGSPRGTWGTHEISPAEEIAAKLRCEYQEEVQLLSFSELDIRLPPLARASGPLQVHLGKDPSVNWSLQASVSLSPFLQRLKPYLRSWPAALDAGGEVSLEGDLRHFREGGPRTEVLIKTSFTNAELTHSGRDFTWRSSLSGLFTLSGVLPEIETAGRLTLREGNLIARNLRGQNISARVEIRVTPSRLLVPAFFGRADQFWFRVGEEERILAAAEFEGQGSLEQKGRRIVIDSMKLRSRDFSSFQVQAEVGLASGGKRSLHARSSSLDVGRVLSFFKPLLPSGVLSWNPQGRVAFEAAVEEITRPERKWEATCMLSGEGLQLSNPAVSLTAEGLAPEFRFSGGYLPSGRVLSLDSSLSLAKGEMLWRECYVDWAAHPLRVLWRSQFAVPVRNIAIQELELSLLPIGLAKLRGSAISGVPLSIDLQIYSRLEDPASLIAFIGGPARAVGLAAAWRGALSLDARIHRAGDSFSLAGQIQVQNGSINGGNGVPILAGIDARLPFCFVRGGLETERAKTGEEGAGYIRVEDTRGSGLALGTLQLDILSYPNRWQIGPVSFDHWGGRASFGATTFTVDPYSLRVEGRTSLVFRDGDLARALPAPAGGLLTGVFSADFPSVEVGSDKIVMHGEAKGKLFSGSVTLRNLRLERPFSRRRAIVLDASFAGLDLEQMTDALPFGRVTGLVRGEVEGLALSYGQPESFRFELESVKKRGVRQTFSLKAVDSLTILSQGEGAVPSQSFFLRFIPAFPYEKIGIQCSLRNDVFRLGGLIKEDGVEYLVRRARPFGIDIINRDPSKMISFKDMVSRLKRIGASREE